MGLCDSFLIKILTDCLNDSQFFIKKHYMKVQEVLSELEKDKLKLVASDEAMMGAIKKVVLSAVYFDGTLLKKGIPDPLKNFTLALASQPGVSDEQLGKNMKASLAAVQLLEVGFKDLERFAVEKVTLKEAVNGSR